MIYQEYHLRLSKSVVCVHDLWIYEPCVSWNCGYRCSVSSKWKSEAECRETDMEILQKIEPHFFNNYCIHHEETLHKACRNKKSTKGYSHCKEWSTDAMEHGVTRVRVSQVLKAWLRRQTGECTVMATALRLWFAVNVLGTNKIITSAGQKTDGVCLFLHLSH